MIPKSAIQDKIKAAEALYKLLPHTHSGGEIDKVLLASCIPCKAEKQEDWFTARMQEFDFPEISAKELAANPTQKKQTKVEVLRGRFDDIMGINII